MADYYFHVTTPRQAIHSGNNKLDAAASGIYNGMLADVEATSGSMKAATGGSAFGQFYDHMALVYTPTSEDLGAYLQDRYVNVVTGVYEALIGPNLFVEGSIPAVDTKLYPGAGAKLTVTVGTNVVGQVIRHQTVQKSSGAFSAALCKMDFSALL